jgi:diketogulonate reductase-like aldo/keto reductase
MKPGSEFKRENLVQVDIPSTWRAMEALYDSGKARAIGVSNFSSKKLQDLLNIARVPPAVNQVELHPGWQQPKLHTFCQSKGIHLSVSIIDIIHLKELAFLQIHQLICCEILRVQ